MLYLRGLLASLEKAGDHEETAHCWDTAVAAAVQTVRVKVTWRAVATETGGFRVGWEIAGA